MKSRLAPPRSARLVRLVLLIPFLAPAPPPVAPLDRLKLARTWMYQIQDLEKEGAVEALARSAYDVLVVEPTNTVKGSESFDGKGMVKRLREGRPGRIVLAYVDIGEAESYRTYWRKEWKPPTKKGPGDPDFIVAADPDGWSENYPAAFWDKRWIEIVAGGEKSVVQGLLADGYDGIYMDWIEAYDEERVRAAAKRAGVEPAKAMVDFILRIRETARKASPGFLLVAQNAPGLLDLDPRYKDAIDAIGQEDVWFRGTADKKWEDPKGGDIPNKFKDESSTAGLVRQLKRYQALGKPVFTIDYCLKPENAKKVYEASRKEGFVPLVTRVSLSRMTETPPPAPAPEP